MINRIKQYSQEKNIYFAIFLLIESIVFILFSAYNLYKHGKPLNLLMLSSDSQFGDFFMHIGYASAPIGTNIYAFSADACFPPLAYTMYGILARITGYRAENPIDTTAHMNVGNNLTIYLIYTIVCIVLLLYAISLFQNKYNVKNQVLFPCLLIVSYPFALSSLQRGNSVLLVAILLCIALSWRDDKSKIKQEMAMVIIAVCAGLKIYPAIFGLLYLKERRYWQTLRLVIYGIIFFFVPFLWFGGIDGMRSFFETLFILNGVVHLSSVQGISNKILQIFGIDSPTTLFVIQQLFLIISLIGFFLCKSKWGEVLLLSGLMTMYISSSWMYTCVYMLPPLLMFFKETNKGSAKIDLYKLIYTALFSVIFSIPYFGNYPLIYLTILLFVVIVATNSVISSFKNKKIKHHNS